MPSIEYRTSTSPGFDDLLSSIVAMDTQALRKLLNQLQQVVESRQNAEAEDVELLQKIRAMIPASLVRRYRQLHTKQQVGAITANEQAEMRLLTDFMEEKSAERVALLARLAGLRKMPLPDLAKQLRIQHAHG